MEKRLKKSAISFVLLLAFLLTNVSPVFAAEISAPEAPPVVTEVISPVEPSEPPAVESPAEDPIELPVEEESETGATEPDKVANELTPDAPPPEEPAPVEEPKQEPVAEPVKEEPAEVPKEEPTVEAPVVEAPVKEEPPVEVPAVEEPAAPLAEPEPQPPVSEPVKVPATKTPLTPQPVILEAEPTIFPTAAPTVYNPNPGYYTSDAAYIALCADFKNPSINRHTLPERVWVQGGMVHVAVKSTHLINNMKINTLVDAYEEWVKVYVDTVELELTGLNGNTNDSHWTIYKWPLSAFNLGTDNVLFVEGIGGGHDVTDVITVSIPETKLTINKTWLGILPDDGTKVSFKVYGMPGNVLVKETSITYPTLSVTINVPVATNIGGLYTHYRIEELGITGYESNGPVNSSPTNEKHDTEVCGVKFSFFKHTATVVNRPDPIDISVEKVWDGGETLKAEVFVQLTRWLDGEDPDPVGSPVALNAGNTWKYTWENKPRVNDSGETWNYGITESGIPANFAATLSDPVVDDMGNISFTLTNTYTPPRGNIVGSKTWVNGDPQDWFAVELELYRRVGAGPGSLVDQTPVVTKNGDDQWIYTWENLPLRTPSGELYIYYVAEPTVPENYNTSVDGLDVTNTFDQGSRDIPIEKIWVGGPQVKPEITIRLLADGVEVDHVVLPDGDTTHTFLDFPIYNVDGSTIVYTITEDAVPGYDTTIDGFEVTNDFDEGSRDIPIEKIWVGGPQVKPTITINLLADGVEVDEVILENGELTHTFMGFPVYNSDGSTIVYTITEDAVEGYLTTIDGFEVTNDFDEGSRDIPIEKIWVGGPQVKPTITINLLADGVEVDEVILENGELTHTFMGFPVYNSDGSTIVYTITEDEVEGYLTTIDGFEVTNDFDEGSRDIPIEKIWVGGPEVKPTITIRLLADGVEVAMAVLPNGHTEHMFTDLPVYNSDGSTIVYTITEDAVEGYLTTIDGFEVTNDFDEGLRDITIEKIWIGGPEVKPEITINLLADGVEVDEVKLAGMLEHTFTDLPIYNSDGSMIVYTITEDPVPNYKTTIEDFTVTNLWDGELPNTGASQSALPLIGAVLALGGIALTLKKKNNR